MSVATFEETPHGLVRRPASPSLAEAAAGLPDGAYTTLRTYDRDRLLRLDRHLDRLDESLRLQGRDGRVDRAAVVRLLSHAIREAGHPESRLRVHVAPPHAFVSIEAFAPPPESLYRDGARCVTVALSRHEPRAKDTRFLATAATRSERCRPACTRA